MDDAFFADAQALKARADTERARKETRDSNGGRRPSCAQMKRYYWRRTQADIAPNTASPLVSGGRPRVRNRPPPGGIKQTNASAMHIAMTMLACGAFANKMS